MDTTHCQGCLSANYLAHLKICKGLRASCVSETPTIPWSDLNRINIKQDIRQLAEKHLCTVHKHHFVSMVYNTIGKKILHVLHFRNSHSKSDSSRRACEKFFKVMLNLFTFFICNNKFYLLCQICFHIYWFVGCILQSAAPFDCDCLYSAQYMDCVGRLYAMLHGRKLCHK